MEACCLALASAFLYFAIFFRFVPALAVIQALLVFVSLIGYNLCFLYVFGLNYNGVFTPISPKLISPALPSPFCVVFVPCFDF